MAVFFNLFLQSVFSFVVEDLVLRELVLDDFAKVMKKRWHFFL